MAIRNCSDSDNAAGAKKATEQFKGAAFAPLSVRIEHVDLATHEVRFSAKGSAKMYSAPWRAPDLWIECPTTIASSNGVPAAGTEGTLYVGRAVYQKLDTNAAQFAGPKWPEEAPLFGAPRTRIATDEPSPGASTRQSTPYGELTLSASSIRITASVLDFPGHLVFDLMEPGSPNHQLDLRAVYNKLSVKHHATAEYRQVEMKVLHAVLHATNQAIGMQGQVDLMNPLLADAFQVLDLSNHREIPTRLSPRGFALFGAGMHL